MSDCGVYGVQVLRYGVQVPWYVQVLCTYHMQGILLILWPPSLSVAVPSGLASCGLRFIRRSSIMFRSPCAFIILFFIVGRIYDCDGNVGGNTSGRNFKRLMYKSSQWPAFMYRIVPRLVQTNVDCAAQCQAENEICDGFARIETKCYLGNLRGTASTTISTAGLPDWNVYISMGNLTIATLRELKIASKPIIAQF